MSPNGKPILAAVSLDSGSRDILSQADALARYHDVGLAVCHVIPDICAMRPLFPQFHLDDALKFTEMEIFIQGKLEELIRTHTDRALSEVGIVIEQGSVHAGILRAAERLAAGLLVVGGTGGGKVRSSLGRSAQIAVRDAPCPVLVVRPTGGGKVLAATDFSDPATPAIEAASIEARRRNVDLAIIHVIDTLPRFSPSVYDFLYFVPPLDFHLELRRHWRKKLDECVTRHKAKGGGVLRQGPVVPALLSAVRKLSAQLLVVGSHGLSGLDRFALGSVAETIARKASCSVLVVRSNVRAQEQSTD